MLNAAAVACIEQVRLGFVASVTSGGRPSVSPKGSFVVLDERTIAFAEIRSPGTISNIGHSPEVEVNFVDSFRRKGWRMRGSRKYCAVAVRILRRSFPSGTRSGQTYLRAYGPLL